MVYLRTLKQAHVHIIKFEAEGHSGLTERAFEASLGHDDPVLKIN